MDDETHWWHYAKHILLAIVFVPICIVAIILLKLILIPYEVAQFCQHIRRIWVETEEEFLHYWIKYLPHEQAQTVSTSVCRHSYSRAIDAYLRHPVHNTTPRNTIARLAYEDFLIDHHNPKNWS